MNVMKLNQFLNIACCLMLSTAVLSCGDDENYDVTVGSDNLAYFPTEASRATQNVITITPAGAIGNIGKLKVLFQRPVSSTTTVSVIADETLARQYNEANETEYPVLPSSIIDYTFATATVEKGMSESAENLSIRLSSSALSQLTEPHYLAAFKMNEVKGEGRPSSNRNVYYSLVSANIQDKLHVVSGDVVSFSVNSTPAGSFGSVSFEQPYTFSGDLNNKATITLSHDQSLVSAYNESHAAKALPLPDGVLAMENATVTVENGQSVSTDNFRITIPEANLSKLTGEQYVIPFKVSTTPDGGQTVSDAGVFYMVVNVEWKLANADATLSDLKGEMISMETMKTWTEKSGMNISQIIDDVRSTNWKRGTYTIDMKQSYKVSGLKLLTRYAKSTFSSGVRLELSEDGETWSDAGVLTNMPKDEGDFDYCNYILYGGVSARYMRITYGTTMLSELRVFTE